MNGSGYRRRDVVCTAGIAAVTLLAGCSSGNADAGGSDEVGSDGDAQSYVSDEPAYDGWFEDTDNYEGTLDLTGQDAVTVAVGSEQFSFDPPAIAVDPGTTVTWEWTGEGGGHNVASKGDGPLESETTDEAGHAYEYTFEESGTYLYQCDPHATVGMKGAVYVE